MADASALRSVSSAPPVHKPRVLGDLGDPARGPTVVLLGGVHGNEPGGLLAIPRVLDRLDGLRVALRGRVIGVVGNRGASQAGRRYLGEDLNRRWPLACGHVAGRSLGVPPESMERRELLDLLGTAEHDARSAGFPGASAPIALDLHSTSAPTPPFAVLPDVVTTWPWIEDFKVPMLLGLDELTEGTLLGWLADRGWTAMSLEGGQHDAPETSLCHEAAVWLVLRRAGLLPPAAWSEALSSQVRTLAAAGSSLPPAVELVHRHAISPEDRFVMKPGFASFDRVRAGDLLAEDARGPVRAQRTGRVIMPLYQGLGDDGYFLGRDVSVSELALRARSREGAWIDAILAVPGITRAGRQGFRVAAGLPRALVEPAVRCLAWHGFRRVSRLDDDALWVRRRGTARP